jgi:hypothetical protein
LWGERGETQSAPADELNRSKTFHRAGASFRVATSRAGLRLPEGDLYPPFVVLTGCQPRLAQQPVWPGRHPVQVRVGQNRLDTNQRVSGYRFFLFEKNSER